MIETKFSTDKTFDASCPECKSTMTLPDLKSIDAPARLKPKQLATVCPACTTFLVLAPDKSVRTMTLDEVATLPDDMRNVLIRSRRRFEQRNADVGEFVGGDCPKCGKTWTTTERLRGRGARPKAGDIAQCGYCLIPLLLLDGGKVRELTYDEFASLPREVRTAMTQEMLRALVEESKG